VALFVVNSDERETQRARVQFNVCNELLPQSPSCRLDRIDDFGLLTIIDEEVSCVHDIHLDVTLPPLSVTFYTLCSPEIVATA
jgi:hypothetical protein